MRSRLVLLLFLLVLPAAAPAVTPTQQLDAYEALLKQFRDERSLKNYDFELDRLADWIGEARQHQARGNRVWMSRTLRRVAAQARYLEALSGRTREIAVTDQRRRDLEAKAAKLASLHAELRKLDGRPRATVEDASQASLEIGIDRRPIDRHEGRHEGLDPDQEGQGD